MSTRNYDYHGKVAASMFEVALETVVLLGGNSPLAVIAAIALATFDREYGIKDVATLTPDAAEKKPARAKKA